MDNEELRKLLQQLHDEIKNARQVDEKGSQLLRDLDMDIHAFLDRSEGAPAPLHPSFVKRLEGSLYHFEATHPSLTTVISRLLAGLSNAGI
jgi:hypothetical protein